MSIVSYIADIFKKMLPDPRYRLVREAWQINRRLDMLLSDLERVADLDSQDAFEHDVSLMNQDLSEIEGFATRLSRHGLKKSAQKVTSKVQCLRDYCESTRQRYE